MKTEPLTPTNRELVASLLQAVHPDLDVHDDESLFGQIYDDYEKYADLITSREADIAEAETRGELRGRNAKIEEALIPVADGDGVPDLGGANTNYSPKEATIFDIARGL